MLSQEFVFKSKYKGNYQWVAGVFGFVQMLDKPVDVDDYSRKMKILRNYKERNIGFAVFHQSSVENLLIKGLTLTAGIRIDFEENQLDYRDNIRVNGNVIKSVDTSYAALSYNEVSPKIAFSYALNKNTSIYALAAKGYKTGGFNTTVERPEDLTFFA